MSREYISVVESPSYFFMDNDIVFIFGGVFQIGDKVVSFDSEDDRVCFISLDEYCVDYTDFNHFLCSGNLVGLRFNVGL